jgi:hypothetical protein
MSIRFAQRRQKSGPSAQMTVPAGKIALFTWALTGEQGDATGKVVATSESIAPEAVAAGLAVGTEYWFVDALVDTGPVMRLVITRTLEAAWDPCFRRTGTAKFTQDVECESFKASTSHVAGVRVAAAATPGGAASPTGLVAVAFEVFADAPTAPPSWFWTPGAVPNLFGAGAESGHIELVRVHPENGGHPGPGWWYCPGS